MPSTATIVTFRSCAAIVITIASRTVSLFTIYDPNQYLRRKLKIKVDIVSKEFLNKYLKDQVLKEAIAV